MGRLLTCVVTLVCAMPAVAGPLQVGVAAVDITPPKGCPMAGYYSYRGAEGTHDPLWAKALVLEKDGTTVALVALDLISTPRNLVEQSRQAIEKRTAIPAAQVMIAATHSHTGPILPDGSARADIFTADGAKIAKEYVAGLPGQIAEAVGKAHAARRPARVSFATGIEDGLAFNRRFHMNDGSIGWNPGKKNPNIVRPAGPTDPSVPVVFFETDEKQPQPIAIYVNFAMHLDTVGGLFFSADYPYTLARCLAAVYGEKVVTVFTTGCCGDINHINVASDKPQKGPGEAARIGTRLAAAVLRTLDRLTPAADGPLRVSREIVELPLAPVTNDDVAAAQRVVAALEAKTQPAPKFLDQVQAFKVLDIRQRLGNPLAVEVQVISLGRDLAWVSLPGEIFVELGLQIKQGSPFQQTMIAELANGSIGYIPTRVAYSQGHYEVVSTRCAEGSGEKLVDVALQQLRTQFKQR
ncbi:MAG: neutral/alkaline non-lysosomal ceramidase N-terminal domain-containing protein [Gemmataceae bacterium]|nr:neutral/alkaline non-lysosomal ceramidase N-terminal domain-containing protein [Gemmata sp.]MDW8197346.1 neutral/alkaline non-lysosomal ceramidase N-terminal domain-containing protein [Gemmataceae bacterium]